MNLEFKRKLPTLQEIKAMYPLDDALAAHKKDTDATLKNIFSGKDNRLLLVIGPCSADREDAVLDYISRLRRVQEKVADKIVIVPRIYQQTAHDGRRLQGNAAPARSQRRRKYAERADRHKKIAHKGT